MAATHRLADGLIVIRWIGLKQMSGRCVFELDVDELPAAPTQDSGTSKLGLEVYERELPERLAAEEKKRKDDACVKICV